MVSKSGKCLKGAVLPGILLIVMAALILIAGTPVLAAKDLVVDQADVFTAEQEHQLEQTAAELGAAYAMDVVIVTTNDTGGKTSMEYADDFFDYNGYGVGDTYDGVLMLMDFQNRTVWISTTGKAIDVLTDNRIERILDAMYDGGMTDGDYYFAAQAFLDSTDDYFKGNTLTLVDSIIALLVSGGAGAGIIGNVRSRYKGKTGRQVFSYQNNSLVNLGVVADNLTNSYTTSRVIPRPTSSSGGGGGSSTHTGSSGRTHGGGGRGF